MKKNKKKVKIDVILLYFRRRRIRDALMKRCGSLKPSARNCTNWWSMPRFSHDTASIWTATA